MHANKADQFHDGLLLFVWNTLTVSSSLDNHSTASGPAWCRRCMPPGNAVSGHSSTMCLVVWWLSPHGQVGDAITPHQWRDSAYLAWPHLRRFSVTNWRLGRVNPGCGHVGSVTRSCPGCSLESTTAPMSPAPFVFKFASRAPCREMRHGWLT